MITDHASKGLQKPWIKIVAGDEILDEKFFGGTNVKEYRDLHERLWHNLVAAHSSMFILKEVMEFPVSLLLPPQHQTFFALIIRNFFNEVVLIVHNALASKDPRNITVETLKQWLLSNTLETCGADLQIYLEEVSGRKGIGDILARLGRLRNKYIAHLDKEHFQNEEKRQQAHVTFRELRELLEGLLHETDRVVNKLSLEGGMSMVPPWYAGDKTNSDIYHILNAIAKDSTLIKMPEEQRDSWAIYKDNLTENERKTFNNWRKRIGKDEIPF